MDAIGTKVSDHYIEGGRSSGVAIKRGSTVQRQCYYDLHMYPNHITPVLSYWEIIISELIINLFIVHIKRNSQRLFISD